MSRPNLFSYATSELSQDAVLCWMLEWANSACRAEDVHLHELGRGFIALCMERHNFPVPERIEKVEVQRQVDRVDLEATVDGEVLLLIEDKVFTREHSNQLTNYLEKRKAERPDVEILSIYVQTGLQADHDAVHADGFRVVNRTDLIGLCQHAAEAGCTNAILLDFLAYLNSMDQRFRLFEKEPFEKWKDDGLAWQGFFDALKTRPTIGGWGYVANRSGGFWGYWSQRNEGPVCNPYWQLENEKLCFKLYLGDEADRANGGAIQQARRWNDLFLTASSNVGFSGVTKPPRLRGGEYMTVAQFNTEDALHLLGSNGVLDMDKTVALLRAADRVVEEAARLNAETGR